MLQGHVYLVIQVIHMLDDPNWAFIQAELENGQGWVNSLRLGDYDQLHRIALAGDHAALNAWAAAVKEYYRTCWLERGQPRDYAAWVSDDAVRFKRDVDYLVWQKGLPLADALVQVAEKFRPTDPADNKLEACRRVSWDRRPLVPGDHMV